MKTFKTFLNNPSSVLELALTARNFSLRPSDLYGLDDSHLIHTDFDLCCNLRLRLHDIEEDAARTQELLVGLATATITGTVGPIAGSPVEDAFEKAPHW